MAPLNLDINRLVLGTGDHTPSDRLLLCPSDREAFVLSQKLSLEVASLLVSSQNVSMFRLAAVIWEASNRQT